MINLFKDPFFNIMSEFSVNDQFGVKTRVNKLDDSYLIRMAVPGLTKEDLKITTKDGILKISFDGSEDKLNEFFVSAFTKSYSIPDDVNEKDIFGKVENGLLEVSLPISKKKNHERLITLN